MANKFKSRIEVGEMRIETTVDHPFIEHGINLSGTIYIEGAHESDSIDTIKLEVFKMTEGEQKVVSKHSIELVGGVASKDTQMMPFEIMPDERWLPEGEDEFVKLILRTTVYFENGEELQAEGEIYFDIEE